MGPWQNSFAERLIVGPAAAALPADHQTGPGAARHRPGRRHHAGRPHLGAEARRRVVRRPGGRAAGRRAVRARRPGPDYQPVGFGDGPPLFDPSVPFAGAHRRRRAGDGRGDRRRRLPAQRPRPGGLRDPRLRRVRLARGGRADRGPPARPVPPDRHPQELATRPDRARRDTCSRSRPDRDLLFEGTFPLPRVLPAPRRTSSATLDPGELRTTCAYKGHATHYDVTAGDEVLPNMAWSYERAARRRDRRWPAWCPSTRRRLDVWLDDESVERVRTPWSS